MNVPKGGIRKTSEPSGGQPRKGLSTITQEADLTVLTEVYVWEIGKVIRLYAKTLKCFHSNALCYVGRIPVVNKGRAARVEDARRL